jgi:hypothetical protein
MTTPEGEVDPRVPLGAVGVALLSLAVLFARDPFRVERWFVEAAGPRLTALVAAPIARAPFSVAEWVEALAILVALAWATTVAATWWRSRGARWAVVRAAGATAVATLAWVGVAFYASWGLSYARPAADVRMGFRAYGDRPREITTDELVLLAEDYIDRTNRLYLELHGGWPDGLTPTTPPHDWLALDAAVDEGWAQMAGELSLHPSAASPRGPSKPLASSRLFSWLGIGGFYFPFTGEANLNALAPAWGIPSTMAHEKAHQRFVASEDEANYFGWLATVYASDPWVRYSGWMFAHRQVLFALEDRDPRTFHWLVRRRLPGVQRDVIASRRYWAGYDGPLERVSDRVNDTYLKLNAVRGGTRSYSAALVLIAAHARQHPLP